MKKNLSILAIIALSISLLICIYVKFPRQVVSAQSASSSDFIILSGQARSLWTDSSMSDVSDNFFPSNKAIVQFIDSAVNGCIVKQPKLYNSSGLIPIAPFKIWTETITPSTGSGQVVDISSAGFSTILSVQLTATNNTNTISSMPFVSLQSYTSSQVTFNILTYNSGFIVPSSLTGVTIQVLVIGY